MNVRFGLSAILCLACLTGCPDTEGDKPAPDKAAQTETPPSPPEVKPDDPQVVASLEKLGAQLT